MTAYQGLRLLGHQNHWTTMFLDVRGRGVMTHQVYCSMGNNVELKIGYRASFSWTLTKQKLNVTRFGFSIWQSNQFVFRKVTKVLDNSQKTVINTKIQKEVLKTLFLCSGDPKTDVSTLKFEIRSFYNHYICSIV